MTGVVVFLLLVSAACVFSSVVIDDLEVEKSWTEFKNKHNKVYKDEDEHAYRKAVFEKSLQQVMSFNLAYERGDETYTIGINKWSDMTHDEWLQERYISCDYKERADTSANNTQIMIDMLTEFGNPPAQISYKDYVSDDVRDQTIGACGGCYTFAAVSAVESMWARKHMNGTSKPHLVPILSEQMVIDCGFKYHCKGCKGGHPCSAYDTMYHEGGLPYWDEYPWRKVQTDDVKNCKKTKKVFSKVVKIAKTYQELNNVTESNRDENLMIMVGNRGPVTASVCANDKFKKYTGGIFNDPKCYTECKVTRPSGINHSILVIGYTKDYYVIRNSWGDGWGEKGYMRIKRAAGAGICGLGKDVSQPTVTN